MVAPPPAFSPFSPAPSIWILRMGCSLLFVSLFPSHPPSPFSVLMRAGISKTLYGWGGVGAGGGVFGVGGYGGGGGSGAERRMGSSPPVPPSPSGVGCGCASRPLAPPCSPSLWVLI
uniref:Uncharacterized protein n=1 Tax=Knipowitschia caucasica TaxID=637954 RepID=A0AAV2K7Z4_KNICA